MSTVKKLDSVETPNEITEKYKKIIKANGIHDEVSEVIVKHSGLQGAGLASKQLYITVKFVDSKINPLNLFVKEPCENPKHSELIDDFKAFEKESRFFTEYIPAVDEFCKSKGVDGILDFYPKCYYGDKTLMVLENLVLDKGYSLLELAEKHDMEVVRFAITNLAKHHGLSYAFIRELGGPEPFFKRFPILDFDVYALPSFRNAFESMMENAIKSNIQILERNDIPGRDRAIKKLESLVGKSFDMMLNAFNNYDPEEEKLFLLNHGDYWGNNMMFKKDKVTNRITSQIAIDFQFTLYNSLGLDIGFYLFTSIKPDLRRAHWQEILEMYLSTLKETCAKLGHPVDLSYDELHLIVRKKIDLGFWISVGFTDEAGLAANKEINVNELGDKGNYSAQLNKFIKKWIDENPQKVAESAMELVKLMDEYTELSIQ
ncbi:unnamed protein product [Orchesella dallaii]|uniref:CHK kinase-like domain-containing protein n=1 Tax=Orchesella dallaii TaxID=48710 RepID=A0ABP1RFE3_9HEXA